MNKTLAITLVLCFFVGCAQLKKVEKQLNRNDSKLKKLSLAWIKNLDPSHSSGNLPVGGSSPFIADDIVYIGSLSGSMHAYDLNSGRVVWTADEKQPINAMANIFEGNVIYGSQNGRFFSRDKLSGELNYALDLGSPIESQPIIRSGRAIIHLRNHTIVTLDAATGKVFWRYRRSIPFTTTLQRVSKVLPVKNHLVVGFADGYVAAISLEEGSILWEQKISTGVKFVDVDASPILYNGKIVVGSASGPVRFLNPRSGAIETTIEFSLSHTPLQEKSHLIMGSTFGDIYRVNRFGKIMKRKSISKDAISSIKPYGIGFMIATMGSDIFYVNKDFDVLDTFKLGNKQSAVFGEIVGEGDSLALYSSRNRLYVFK